MLLHRESLRSTAPDLVHILKKVWVDAFVVLSNVISFFRFVLIHTIIERAAKIQNVIPQVVNI
jgi:hypothetical protein